MAQTAPASLPAEKKPDRFAFWQRLTAFNHPATVEAIDGLAKISPEKNSSAKIKRLIDLGTSVKKTFERTEKRAIVTAFVATVATGVSLLLGLGSWFDAVLSAKMGDTALLSNLLPSVQVLLGIGIASIGVTAAAIHRVGFADKAGKTAESLVVSEVQKTLAAEPALKNAFEFGPDANRLREMFDSAAVYSVPVPYQQALEQKIAQGRKTPQVSS